MLFVFLFVDDHSKCVNIFGNIIIDDHVDLETIDYGFICSWPFVVVNKLNELFAGRNWYKILQEDRNEIIEESFILYAVLAVNVKTTTDHDIICSGFICAVHQQKLSGGTVL